MAKFKKESDWIVGPLLRAMFIFTRRPKRLIQAPRAARTPRRALTSTENLPERPKRIINRPSRYAAGDTSFKSTLIPIKKRKTKIPSKESSPEVSSVKAAPKNPSLVSETPEEAEKVQMEVLTIEPKVSQSAQQCAFELSSCGVERLEHPMSQSRLI